MYSPELLMTERPPETCRVLYKNKLFEKLVHLVCFTIGIPVQVQVTFYGALYRQ
jgi:hypothetical protein